MDAELRARVEGRTTAAEGGCLLWLGGTDTKGYPRVTVGRQMRLVRRLVVEDALGSTIADPSIVVVDTCGNRRCVARDHLRLTARGSAVLPLTCARGHRDDWYVSATGSRRECRGCRRERKRRRRLTGSGRGA
jgi:hypothetical protein